MVADITQKLIMQGISTLCLHLTIHAHLLMPTSTAPLRPMSLSIHEPLGVVIISAINDEAKFRNKNFFSCKFSPSLHV